jgi:uncharacterized protein YjbJ (UPF0337 family)
MVNQQTLQGNWNEIKGRLRNKWGQLTNDELQSFDGNVERLIGLIQRKTGEGRSSVEHFLEELTSNGASTISQATAAVGEYAQQAAGRLQEGSKQAAESMRHGYEEAERMVKQRPAESVAVCFGAGVLAGLMLGLMMRSR